MVVQEQVVHQDLLVLPVLLVQMVVQEQVVHQVRQDLAEQMDKQDLQVLLVRMVHQVHQVHQDHQEQRVSKVFLLVSFIILINLKVLRFPLIKF